LNTWLIDTPLFATFAPSAQKSALRHWLDMHREPVFLSTASLVEIAAAIERVPASQQLRICALRDWLDGLTSAFSDATAQTHGHSLLTKRDAVFGAWMD
jgi:hypothetical protein